MNKQSASRVLLFILLLALFNSLNFTDYAQSTTGSPTSIYHQKNLNVTGSVQLKNNSPSDFYKILNTINISTYSVVTGYQFGYESTGTTVNFTITSMEKNISVSELRTIPANDSSNLYRRIFEANSSLFFLTNKNINLSMEVQSGADPINIHRGSPSTISNNAFYWSNTESKWTSLQLYELDFAPIVEEAVKLELNKTTSHIFNSTTYDGITDAFFFNRSDFTHDSALRFKIDKTTNPLAGNLSFEVYLADSGKAFHQLIQVINDTLPDTTLSKTFDFDQRPYQDQEFILVIRSLENKNIGYNITMFYTNPPYSDENKPLINTAGIIIIVVIGVLVLLGVGYYIWKSQR